MKEYKIFEKYLSASRIDRYLIAVQLDEELCISLYKTNIKLSNSFYPILGIFEVVLRNEIDKVLVKYFNDSDWILNQQKGFMIAPELSYKDSFNGRFIKNRYIYNSVENTKIKLNNKSTQINSNRIIAEQSLSFWTEMFEKKYYKLLKGRPIQIFNNLPPYISRVDILNKLTKIRKFRNRIYHNEPICFNEDIVDLQGPMNIYYSIIDILNWINPETLILLNDVDEVPRNISKI